MKDWLKRGLALGIVLGAFGVGASACADNESSIFIRGVLVPDGSSCSYSADPGSAELMLGVMDLAFTREYWAGLLIGNQLVPRGSQDRLRVETSRFRVEGAEVKIEGTAGQLYGAFTVPVAGFADPGNASDPGWGVVMAVLINSDTSKKQFASAFTVGERSVEVGRVVAVVKVFGRTLGGQEVESGQFRYPISVCHGCLVSFPPEATDPAGAVPNCDNIGGDEGGGVSLPCLVGQDDALDCRACQALGGGSLCRP